LGPTAACIPPGTYRVEVLTPTGAYDYSWQEQTGLVQTPPRQGTRVYDVVLTPGNALCIVTVAATSPNCPPVTAAFQFPPRSGAPCPHHAVLKVTSGGHPVPLPVTALPPGNYEIEISSPVGPGLAYSFAEAGSAGTPFTPVHTFPVTLTAPGARTFVVVTDAGPCCLPLPASITLDVARTSGPFSHTHWRPGGGGPGSGGGGSGPRLRTILDWARQVARGGSASPSLCDLFYALLIAALLATVAFVDGAVCTWPVGAPTLGTVAAGTAIVVGTMCAALVAGCGWTQCRVVGSLAWGCMWGFLLSAPIAIGCASLVTFVAGVVFAIVAGLLSLWLHNNGCPIPQPHDLP